MIKISWLLSLLILVLAQFPATALAQSIQDLQNYQQQVIEQRELIQKQQAQINAIAKPAEIRLDLLRKNVQATDAEIQKNQQKLSDSSTSLKNLQAQLEKSTQALELQRTATTSRLQYLQKQQTAQWWALLLSSKDLSQFLDRRRQLSVIYKSDRTLLATLKHSNDLVNDQAQTIINTQNQIILLNQELAQQKQNFEAQATAQAQVVTRLKSDRQALEAAESRLVQDSIQIRNIILAKTFTPDSIIPGTGQMMYPVIAPITSPFGYRMHPILGYQKFHSGMDFGADYGTVIYAADSGNVVFAGWYGGYGNAVIIEHGNGISTLYGHTSEVYVTEGQAIQKGQPIARVGSTGFSTGPHLHFEVRVNGEPVDPAQFL
ncbi:metalloendopeptidase-like membrane protein [Synechococcus sp. PCC 7502]|uniref:murein hydrolase activator EnvC family protein n=1 Tax=Synechococcus sp. PCC 7502 TaxID=1173263 RepID=UPI00029FD0D1|nr:M23 family metallopeptidase [Synechococcus sp. PCC 7502]AFY73397.1 metalloendopeptidase-like membrane protein [Synechococcus sp. PCC 7502]